MSMFSRNLPALDQIDRLLIVKTSSIGDVVHALPVVEAIKKARPEISIGWVVRRRCATVLTGNPNIDTVHLVDNKPKLFDLLRLRRELKDRRYQCALDMQGLFLSGLYTWLSGAGVRIGIDRNREQNKWFLTHPIVSGTPQPMELPSEGGARGVSHPDRHAVDILYGFAEILGVSADHREFAPQTYLADGAPARLIDQVRSLDGPRIALNVGASSKYKRWPDDHWTALADALTATGRSVVFVGANDDGETVDKVTAAMAATDRAIDLTGKTDLRDLAAVLEACDLVVTGDTGPMHIAVAVATPVVALFGSTNPDRTGPYGDRNVVLNMRLSCSPCYRRPTCDGRVDCMLAITPETVLVAVEAKLSAATKIDQPSLR